MKLKQHNLGTESCLTVGDESGDMAKTLSIPLILRKTVANFKPNKLSPYSYFLYKSKKVTSKIKKSGNYPTCRISYVAECRLNFNIKFKKNIKMIQIYSKYK